MTVTYDTSNRLAFTSTTGATLSHTGAVGAVLLANVLVNSTSDVLTIVTYNGVLMTFVNKIETAAIGQWIYTYFISGQCDGSAHNIIASISGAAVLMSISSISYTGASTVAPTGTQTGTSTTSSASTWSQSLTPTSSGAVAMAYISDVIGRAVTAGANTTVRQDGGGQGDHMVDSGIVALVAGSPFTLNISSFSGLSPSTESIMIIINPPSVAGATGNFFSLI